MNSLRTGGLNVAVIGAGSWGTALALTAARNNHHVRLWARTDDLAESIRRNRRNTHYLPEFELPANITPTSSLEEALDRAEFALLVVPSHSCREVVQNMRERLEPATILVSCVKGIENGSLYRISEVLIEVLGPGTDGRIAVLSGPSFAKEVARGDPTAVVAAAYRQECAEEVQRHFSSRLFRPYTNDDVIGVELGGAVKNVVAIATGVVYGLGLGTNSVAAIITRGLSEMTRLAVAKGAKPETLAGLAGLGDLVLTCTGELSRNRRVGFELGRGHKLEEILSGTREVAEGVKTTRAVHEMGNRMGVDLPITQAVYQLLYENKDPRQAVAELMERPLKRE